MSKNRERILLKVNAIIVGLLGLLGMTSCSSPLVKYGIPDDWIPSDSSFVDTTIRCMYGVPSPQLYAPQQDVNPEETPETQD